MFDGGVVVLDTFGVVVAAEPRSAGLQGRDLSGQSFFPRLVRARDQSPVFSDIVSVVPGTSPVVAAAVPISGREGELLGSLVGMFLVNPSGTSALYGEVVKLRLAGKGNVYLVDGGGKVLYHSKASRIGSDLSAQPVVRDVLGGQAGAVRTRDPDGRDIVAGYASVGRTGWGLVTEEAWSVLIGESRDHQLVLICLLILGGAVPILFEFIAYAVDGASRMQGLINDLLAYSRVGSGSKPPQAVDCGSVLRRVVGNLQAAINDAGAEVTSDHLPTVRGDESQLVILFQNLIGNGIKFRSDATPHVHLSAERGIGSWLFSVRDNGIGIEREYSERIFGIFQRLHTREEYPGTGVGLAICKRVVERHDGTILVESEPGNGSVFKFTLPASEEDGR